MSIIPCPECKKNISDSAESCPKCGYKLTPEKVSEIKEKIASSRNIGLIMFAGLSFIILIIYISQYNRSTDYMREFEKKKRHIESRYNNNMETKTSEEPALYQNKDSWEKFDAAYKQELSKNINKPDYSKYSKEEKEIYDFMQSIWDDYESKYGINRAEELVFKATAKKFGISKDKAYKIFEKVDKVVIGY